MRTRALSAGLHRIDARLALAGQHVRDAFALPGPAGDGGGAAVLEIVGMRHDRDRSLPVLRELGELWACGVH
jgi:hypothetical protein